MKGDKSIYLAGFIGSLVSLIASLTIGKGDAIQNTGENIRQMFQLSLGSQLAIRVFLTFFILALGAILCWIYSPNNRVDAFIRGCSTLAMLSLSPNTKIEQLPVASVNVNKQFYTSPITYASPYRTSLFNLARFDDFNSDDFTPNARVISNEWISSCKPSTNFWSFFFNTIVICKTGETLNKNEEIELLEDWYDTPGKGYRYVHIKYRRNKEGWIYSGRDPDVYINIDRFKLTKAKLVSVN